MDNEEPRDAVNVRGRDRTNQESDRSMIKPTFTLHHGDCIEVMRTLPAESVDAIVTSPPYAEQRKSTYGGVAEKDYPTWTVAWMTEARRLIKPDASVIINITPHARGGQISDYVLRTRLAIRDAGWMELDEMIWWKSRTLPTGAAWKPQRTWESLLWYAKHPKPWSNSKADGEPQTRTIVSSSYSLETKKERGWDHYGGGSRGDVETARRRNVVKMQPGGYEGGTFKHPAPFSSELAAWCGRLICPPGGTILDPFSGSASTGVAAIRNGWDYIGIDAVEEYVDMSRKRLEGEAA